MESREVCDLKGYNRNTRERERQRGGRLVGTIADGGRPRLLNCNVLYEQNKEAA